MIILKYKTYKDSQLITSVTFTQVKHKGGMSKVYFSNPTIYKWCGMGVAMTTECWDAV